MAPTQPTTDGILDALARDPRFPRGSAAFDMIKDHIVRLPEVIGQERLGQRVTLTTYFQVQADFFKMLLKTDFGGDFQTFGMLRDVLKMKIVQLEVIAANTGRVLMDLGMSEDKMILSDEFGLSDELKVLYRARRLTFASIVRLQPGIFYPAD